MPALPAGGQGRPPHCGLPEQSFRYIFSLSALFDAVGTGDSRPGAMAMPVIVAMAVIMIMVIMSGIGADHVMMMPGLNRADLLFIADDLGAVFAQLAIHGRHPVADFQHPVDE